jgi:hypothetical protein
MTSGGIRCSKGTPIMKKKAQPLPFIKGGTKKEGEKNKS